MTVPNSVTAIGAAAFERCTGLTSVTIPNSVTAIEYSTFYKCSGLTSVTIPNSVTTIGNNAFSKCSGLTSVTIPNSVTSIGNDVFSGCTGLTSVTIGNSLMSIGDSFLDCYNITSIKVAAANKYYDSRNDCNAIINSSTNELVTGCKNTMIPNSVTSIGREAFLGCTGLYSVNIPTSVTTIGNEAFSGCTGLTSITIPNSVTSLGKYAFSKCSGLTSVTIPSSVVSIERDVFYKCTEIKDFINLSSVPQSNAGSLPTTATVHVLKGCKSVYSASSDWSGYNIVEDAEKFFPLESVTLEKENIYCKVGDVIKLPQPIIEPSLPPIEIYEQTWKVVDTSILSYDSSKKSLFALKEGTTIVTLIVVDALDNMKTTKINVHVGDGIVPETPEESGDPQCEAPIVKYTNGNIICMSATDDAVCHYTCKIMGESEGEDTGSSAGIPLKIEITAYATADGYIKSKNTVKTFDYIPSGSGLKGDMNGDGVVNMQDANIIVNKYLGK